MKRWAQLKELAHSLSRARSFAEETNHHGLATFITNALVGIQSEIATLELAKPQPVAQKTVKPRTTKKPVNNDSSEEVK